MRRFLFSAAVALCLAPTAARAAEPSGGTLSDPAQRLAWKGDMASERDSFALGVALPAGVWDEAGGVQIGIKWQYLSDERRDLDLVVIGPGGTVVSASAGRDEDAETVLLPSALNGPYRVEVHDASGSKVPYEGWVEVERATPVAPLRDLLPNLVAMPQRQIGFPEDIGEGSCLGSEQVEYDAKRCLRLEQSIANVGHGPMAIRYGAGPSGGGLQPLYQLIHRSDGTFHQRLGDQWEFHMAHAHFHYKNFAMSQLWRSDADGRILDAAPVKTGRKNGFCLLDVENVWWRQKGDAPKKHNACDPTIQGIGVGWSDVYNYFLHGQFVEVSGVPDGYYVLETIADPPMPGAPEGSILETDETDNSAFVHLRMTGRKVELISARPQQVPLPAGAPPLAEPPAAPTALSPPPAMPAPRLDVALRTRRLKAGSRRLTLSLSGNARDLRATLASTRRQGHPVATGVLRELRGKGRLRLKLRGRLQRGDYLVKLSAGGAERVFAVRAR